MVLFYRKKYFSLSSCSGGFLLECCFMNFNGIIQYSQFVSSPSLDDFIITFFDGKRKTVFLSIFPFRKINSNNSQLVVRFWKINSGFIGGFATISDNTNHLKIGENSRLMFGFHFGEGSDQNSWDAVWFIADILWLDHVAFELKRPQIYWHIIRRRPSGSSLVFFDEVQIHSINLEETRLHFPQIKFDNPANLIHPFQKCNIRKCN